MCQAKCDFTMCAEWTFDGRRPHLVCFALYKRTTLTFLPILCFVQRAAAMKSADCPPCDSRHTIPVIVRIPGSTPPPSDMAN